MVPYYNRVRPYYNRVRPYYNLLTVADGSEQLAPSRVGSPGRDLAPARLEAEMATSAIATG